jgi:XTP/dITP diphosphohydrolase
MTPGPIFEILIATYNAGKIREVQEALQSLPVRVRYLREFPELSQVDEVGATYEENAVLKALGYANQTGLCALADDSGLEVNALGGKPGVHSARYGGKSISDHDRIQKLLSALSDHRDSDRSARFVCCMALAGWPAASGGESQILTVTEAKCEGAIAWQARGSNGFGFDPVFVPEGYLETFAELPAEVKARISHRAKALAAIRESLRGWLPQT